MLERLRKASNIMEKRQMASHASISHSNILNQSELDMVPSKESHRSGKQYSQASSNKKKLTYRADRVKSSIPSLPSTKKSVTAKVPVAV